jgi:hypothetical protein
MPAASCSSGTAARSSVHALLQNAGCHLGPGPGWTYDYAAGFTIKPNGDVTFRADPPPPSQGPISRLQVLTGINEYLAA